ncbi:MAG TPA: LytR family transcriptional regulator [Acidimicrobiales bacterium]|nr:LytR family transcriptional regulator [Acidimicrobiales bacterium]
MADEDFWAKVRNLPDLERTPGDPGGMAGPTDRGTGAGRVVPPGPAPADGGTSPQQQQQQRRFGSSPWWRRTAIALAVLLFGLPALGLVYGWWRYRGLERVAVSEVLTPASGGSRTILVVGSDSREGLDADRPDAGALLASPVSGQRADTILLIRIDGRGVAFLSLPRDLWLPISGRGGSQRINTAYVNGPEQLIATVQESLGVPVNSYMEIDFSGFDSLVDAAGGVTIDFPYPASDANSGLLVETAGPVRLDGVQALAYVRSRHYTEIVDGRPRVDGTGDLGRTARQQVLVANLVDELAATRNPLALDRAVRGVTAAVRVDDRLGLFDLLGIARRLAGNDPEQFALPVRPHTTSGGAAVLLLGDGAQEVLDRFR